MSLVSCYHGFPRGSGVQYGALTPVWPAILKLLCRQIQSMMIWAVSLFVLEIGLGVFIFYFCVFVVRWCRAPRPGIDLDFGVLDGVGSLDVQGTSANGGAACPGSWH